MKNTELAYAAGILDGEGTACVRQIATRTKAGGFYVSPRVMVTMTCVEIIDWLVSVFGGAGYKRLLKSGKVAYTWQKPTQEAATFLREVLPYLQNKRRQANLIIELCQLQENSSRKVGVFNKQRQEEIYYECRVLNKGRGRISL